MRDEFAEDIADVVRVHQRLLELTADEETRGSGQLNLALQLLRRVGAGVLVERVVAVVGIL